MKKTLILFTVLALALSISGCKKCRKEDPRARILNSGNDKVSVQIMTTGGNTVNLNNIQGGQSSDFVSYAPGEVVFTIAFQSNPDVVLNVVMEECWEYEIVINPNNTVSSLPTDRNE